MAIVRIGIVGLGGICRQRHLPGLSKVEGVELVAVANRSPESSEAAAREFNIPNVCESWTDVVAHDDVDAVLIGTWPYMHHPISIAAFEAGKHVFCQARMAMDYGEAKEMFDSALLSDKVAMLCPVPFGLSIDKTLGRLLRTGVLGEVRCVQVKSLNNAFVDPRTPMSWRKDHRYSGLNALTLGMYIEVIHRWFGWTRAVSAGTQTYTTTRTDALGQETEVKIPDQIVVHAAMEKDVTVQYVFSGVAVGNVESIDLYGTEGTLHYDVLKDVLYHVSDAGTLKPVTILPEDAYDAQNWCVEQDFIDAIREGKDFHPNFEDGLRYMQVTQAVYDSAMSGKVEELEA